MSCFLNFNPDMEILLFPSVEQHGRQTPPSLLCLPYSHCEIVRFSEVSVLGAYGTTRVGVRMSERTTECVQVHCTGTP